MAVITKVSPVIATDKTVYPFVNYVITEHGYTSKSDTKKYEVSFGCFAETYLQSLQIADLVKEAIEADNKIFKYNGSKPDYSDGIIATQSNYEFKN